MRRKHAKTVYGDFGSISSGTMREEDLIPTFADELERLARASHNRDDLDFVHDLHGRMESDDYYRSEAAGYDLNEDLFDRLNNYAPPYAYFGANEGDGADYGFWLSSDLNQNVLDNGGIIVGDTSKVPRGYTGEVLQVNDHGNVTLYNCVRGRLYEIWSLV